MTISMIKKSLLIKSGKHLGLYIGKWSSKVLQSVVDKPANQEVTDDWISVLMLTNALFYIVIDREAYNILSEPDRVIFADSIIDQIANSHSDMWNKPKEVKPTMLNWFSKQLNELGQYGKTLLPEKDKSPAGTLYWEYIKLLGNHGVDLESSIEIYKLISDILPEMYGQLNPTLELLKTKI